MLPLLLLFFTSVFHWTSTYEIGDCGIRYNKFTPSISYGSTTKFNELPWHVALYKMDNSSQYQYICGGSIIDSKVILTAAHCVFDEVKQDIDNSVMMVAAGKHNSSWHHRDVLEQRFQVMSKKVRSTYRGSDNRYQDDVALLALNDSIKFSSVVMPVCIDWNGLYEPKDGEEGIVVGWGFNEKRILSEEPKLAEMLVQNFNECRNNIGEGYASYLTADKICTTNKGNATLEAGDGGGGLFFSRLYGEESRYFVMGVLSGREKGRNNYAFVTNVTSHIPWLNSTLITILSKTEELKGKKV